MYFRYEMSFDIWDYFVLLFTGYWASFVTWQPCCRVDAFSLEL